ncbi:MAG: undecaprenyl diphosphate synthase family protein [Thermoprotei archaeon]|nr:undecaprenyl diphosphate synthase family protein [Thermoprotei archaeon]
MLYHVGIIPDGNRRWARLRGLSLRDAYDAGYLKLKRVLEWLLDFDVKNVSIYAMSRENCMYRGEAEKRILYSILGRALKEVRGEPLLKRHNARVVVTGDLSMMPEHLRVEIERLREETIDGGEKLINIGLCYSLEWEIKAYKGDKLPSLNIPQIDLVIRTGGMRRISGFFPLLIEYAELYFTDTLWPDFSRQELAEAIDWFYKQKRNFGR